MALHKTRPKSPRLQSAPFRRTRSDHQTELVEDYLELIADLIDSKGEARSTEVALRLGVANATVAKMMRRLQDKGFISQEPYRAILLTAEGWAIADQGRRRHAIVENFLLTLGVSPETARIDSEGIEHHVSEETLRAMARYVNRKT
jgi:DtxR family manganese transport transcriptional regulator